MTLRPSFFRRTIRADADGTGFVGVHGFGLEILDGGAYGPENLLELVKGEDAVDTASLTENVLECVPGARFAGEFTGLRLITPRTSPVRDAITVLVWTSPLVESVDAPPTGKSRFLALSRGSQSIAADAFQLLWASASSGEFDRFRQVETLDSRYKLIGWVIQNVGTPANHEVCIWVRQDPFGSSTWMLHKVIKSTTNSITAALPPHANTSAAVFLEDNAPSSQPLVLPPGGVEIYVHNKDSSPATFHWWLGVVGT